MDYFYYVSVTLTTLVRTYLADIANPRRFFLQGRCMQMDCKRCG